MTIGAQSVMSSATARASRPWPHESLAARASVSMIGDVE